MGVEQSEFNKKEFIGFLLENEVSDKIIKMFEEIPEILHKNDAKYNLVIQTRWYDVGKTYREFEMNYYSEKIMEYLFSFKVYTDIELSITHLECELRIKGFINDGKIC